MTPAPAGAPLAVLLDAGTLDRRRRDGEPVAGLALVEVLDHLRVPYRPIASPVELGDSARVLLVAEGGPSPELLQWVRAGGRLVVAAHTAAWDSAVGVTSEPTGSGLVELGELVTARRPLRAVGGVRFSTQDDGIDVGPDVGPDVLARWQDGASAVVRRRYGEGSIASFGPDLAETVLRIRQGYAVTEDGIPASDGTAPIDDDILKCEDGLALDLETDRAWAPGTGPSGEPFEHRWPPPGPTPIFDLPQADLWAAALTGVLFDELRAAAAPAVWLDYWPDGLVAVGHLSHDADLNSDVDAAAALEIFARHDVRVTWCQLYPGGYSPETFAAVAAAGHEQAFHYNAIGDADIASWGWPQFRAQYAWAQAVTGTDGLTTNKNHYTRWEGWGEFYRWCEQVGIELDESRGPSKLGVVGFPFGTAHPYFPLADATDGMRRYDVLSLALHAQDLELAAHASSRDVILDGAESVHGVAHFLFHGPHLRKPDTARAFGELVAAARERGLPWWTANRINAWERVRRRVTVTARTTGDGRVVVGVDSDAELPRATVLLDVPDPDAYRLDDSEAGGNQNDLDEGARGASGAKAELVTLTRHRRPTLGIRLDLTPGRHTVTLRRG